MKLHEAEALVPNQSYAFKIRDWETPLGEVVPGATKVRRFSAVELRGPVGGAAIPFIRVMRADGKDHLIAIETIENCEVAHATQ